MPRDTKIASETGSESLYGSLEVYGTRQGIEGTKEEQTLRNIQEGWRQLGHAYSEGVAPTACLICVAQEEGLVNVLPVSLTQAIVVWEERT